MLPAVSAPRCVFPRSGLPEESASGDLLQAGGADFFGDFVPCRHPNEYIIRVLSFVGSRCTRGCRTSCGVSRVRVLTFLQLMFFTYAQSLAALLRARRPSFCHLQLLSAPAVSWNAARAELFCEDSRPSSLAIHISADRLRDDA